MLMRDEHEVHSDLGTAVQDMSAVAEVEVERLCSSESQRCKVPMPEADRQAILGHRVSDSEDACGTDCAEMADMVRLAKIVHVLSAFGALMYEMLISRPDIAAAVGAFAVGLINR